MSFAGPVDIDHNAVWNLMDRLMIPRENQLIIFDLVCKIHDRLEEKRAEMREEEKANK